MIMVTTIVQALRPFFVTYFIMGFFFYPTKQPASRIPWITYLSILYSLIIWFIFVYLYIMTFTWEEIYKNKFSFIQTIITNYTTIVSLIMSFYHQKKFKMCIKSLAAVNDTLEQLGTPKAYRKMHMYSKRIIIGWIVYCIIINFNDLKSLNKNQDIIWILLRPCVLNYCHLVNTFVEILFIFFLWYIGTRFDKVNEHMRYLLMDKKRVSNGKKLIITLHRYVICTNDYKLILWTLMHLHLELCRITRELNLIFSTQITFEVAYYIASITMMCFGFNVLLMEYRNIVSLPLGFVICLAVLIYIARLYLIHYICECVKVKAKQIDKIFHELTNITQYADIWKEIYQFILQAIRHPLKFTGMGFIYFGDDFLRKICTTVLMYVIILIQMKISIF